MTASLRPTNSSPAVSSIPQRIWTTLLCKRNRLVIAHWITWRHKWWILTHTSSISATESISMPLVVIHQLRARLGLVFQTSGRRFFSRKVAHLKLLECLQVVITLVYFGNKLTVHLMVLVALLWSQQESENSRGMIKTSWSGSMMMNRYSNRVRKLPMSRRQEAIASTLKQCCQRPIATS